MASTFQQAMKVLAEISIHSSNLTASTTPSSQITGVGLELRDNVDSLIGRVVPRQANDGRDGILLESRATVNGSSVWNTLGLWVNHETGERWVGVNEAAPWLKALGLNVVEQTTGFSRNTTNVTEVTEQRWFKCGPVVYFALTCKLASAYTSGASLQLGTAPSGFRPTGTSAFLRGSMPTYAGYIATSGVITFRAGVNVSAGSTVNTSGCFVMGAS